MSRVRWSTITARLILINKILRSGDPKEGQYFPGLDVQNLEEDCSLLLVQGTPAHAP